MTYDVVVKGGRIVDGTGTKAYAGDVAITDGRIVAVGEVTGEAKRTISVDGQVVAPGFIDAHTHYDAQLLWDPAANPSTRARHHDRPHGQLRVHPRSRPTRGSGLPHRAVRGRRRGTESRAADVRTVRLGDVHRLPRLAGRPHRAERRDPGGPQRGAALRDGRGCARTCRHRRRDLRDGAARRSGARRGRGRRQQQPGATPAR